MPKTSDRDSRPILPMPTAKARLLSSELDPGRTPSRTAPRLPVTASRFLHAGGQQVEGEVNETRAVRAFVPSHQEAPAPGAILRPADPSTGSRWTSRRPWWLLPAFALVGVYTGVGLYLVLYGPQHVAGVSLLAIAGFCLWSLPRIATK
jgi:hypothetical protein